MYKTNLTLCNILSYVIWALQEQLKTFYYKTIPIFNIFLLLTFPLIKNHQIQITDLNQNTKICPYWKMLNCSKIKDFQKIFDGQLSRFSVTGVCNVTRQWLKLHPWQDWKVSGLLEGNPEGGSKERVFNSSFL